jgi:hypothetical protein
VSRPPRYRLQRIAAQLHPAALPFHVQAADRTHRAPGWYWRPDGEEEDVYLGYNHIVAEIELLNLIDRKAAA